jgi:hypothetical protein
MLYSNLSHNREDCFNCCKDWIHIGSRILTYIRIVSPEIDQIAEIKPMSTEISTQLSLSITTENYLEFVSIEPTYWDISETPCELYELGFLAWKLCSSFNVKVGLWVCESKLYKRWVTQTLYISICLTTLGIWRPGLHFHASTLYPWHSLLGTAFPSRLGYITFNE